MQKSIKARSSWLARMKQEGAFHAMLLPSVIMVFIFSYIPL